jgi:hypothetical protein
MRHMIAADTEILGGVLITQHGAIVVDTAENPEPFEAVYARIDDALGAQDELPLLPTARVVNRVVMSSVTYSPKQTALMLKQQAAERGLDRVTRNDEIGLSEFVKQRIGVCYEQTLVAGVMVRFLQQRRNLGGRVSIDPPDLSPDEHMWVRLSDASNRVIIDPQERYVTALEQGIDRRSKGYLRTEERLPKFLRWLVRTPAASSEV